MKNYTYSLLVVSLAGVLVIHFAFAQRCKIGEPLPDETEPDLNMTLSSNTTQVGGQIEITCDAGPPRFPITDPEARPEPPAEIQISHDGTSRTLLNRCIAVGISQCKFTLQITETTPMLVVCRATNSGGECRIKFQRFTITPKAITSSVSRQATPGLVLPSFTSEAISSAKTTSPIPAFTTSTSPLVATPSTPTPFEVSLSTPSPNTIFPTPGSSPIPTISSTETTLPLLTSPTPVTPFTRLSTPPPNTTFPTLGSSPLPDNRNTTPTGVIVAVVSVAAVIAAVVTAVVCLT